MALDDQEIADALSASKSFSIKYQKRSTAATAAPINIYNQLGGKWIIGPDDDDDDDGPTSNAGLNRF